MPPPPHTQVPCSVPAGEESEDEEEEDSADEEAGTVATEALLGPGGSAGKTDRPAPCDRAAVLRGDGDGEEEGEEIEGKGLGWGTAGAGGGVGGVGGGTAGETPGGGDPMEVSEDEQQVRMELCCFSRGCCCSIVWGLALSVFVKQKFKSWFY